MEESPQHLIAERHILYTALEMALRINLGYFSSHYCKLNEEGEVMDESVLVRLLGS